MTIYYPANLCMISWSITDVCTEAKFAELFQNCYICSQSPEGVDFQAVSSQMPSV